MPIEPQRLLRGIGKFLAVVVAAGLAGALIGIGLAKLSGNEDTGGVVLPATTERANPTRTTATRTPTATAARTTTTEPTQTTTTRTQTTPATGRRMVPRVQVLSARLGATSAASGRARLTARVRVTNRGSRPLALTPAVLVSDADEVRLSAAGRNSARPLLRTLPVGASATGVLRFTLPPTVTQRLSATPRARLRIAGRTIALKL